MAQHKQLPASLYPSCAARRSGRRNGSLMTTSAAALVAVLLAAGGGVWWWTRHQDASTGPAVMLHTVERDDFALTITERGEVEAFDVTEVRSQVKSNNTTGNAILRIVPEGSVVKEGDFLIELDSSALAAQRTSQKILVNGAKALEVESHNNFDVAVIAKREYLEGTYLQERQTIESEVFVAEENVNRAKEYHAYSQKLASKGYVNELQLEADRFAVEKASKDLQAAKTKLRVLDEFTKLKMVSTLESAILIAKAKWEAAKSSHELELEKLAELDDQIAKCTIVAPQDGVVKYAHETDRRGDQEFIVEEGAVVRERQTIIRLPNAESMRVELTINESLVQYVRPGLPAIIKPVGFEDRVLYGEVEKVNQYAEPTGWRQANVKEYKAFVDVYSPPPDLRAGMTAAVTVRCQEVRDALQVPVQTVYAHGNSLYCFAYDAGKWQARKIQPGPNNDKFFVIESGLNEGDRVAMNPRAYIDEVELPELPPEEAQRAVPQPPGARSFDEAPQSHDEEPTRRTEGDPQYESGHPDAPGNAPQSPGQRPTGPDSTQAPAGAGAAKQAQTAAASPSHGAAE